MGVEPPAPLGPQRLVRGSLPAGFLGVDLAGPSPDEQRVVEHLPGSELGTALD